MNITQIKYVLAVAKYKTMREAANRLFVSQPALSVSIRDLEDELGILIFDRTSKGVTLTEEGHEFLVYAKKAVGQYEVLEEKYLGSNRDREHFSVSTQHYTFATRSFTTVIEKADLARYEFSIHETQTHEVLENVRMMKSEIGIVSYTQDSEPMLKKLIRQFQLKFIPLMKRDTYVYMWKDHPLANAETLSIKELKDYPCVVFDQGDDSDYYITEEAMGNYEHDKLIKSDDRATSMEIIASLGGYAIGSGMLAEKNATLKGLVSVKLLEEDPLTIGYIVRKKHVLSPIGQMYVDELLKYKEL